MTTNFIDFEIDGIDHGDYPDFVDAFICNANVKELDGTIRAATDNELDKLNEDSALVYDLVLQQIF